MNGIMCRYYILKKYLTQIPSTVLDENKITDDIIFKYADFLSTPLFYRRNFKKDKYKIYDKMNGDNFNSFFIETLISASKMVTRSEEFPYDVLIFMYALALYHLEDEILIPYINQNKSTNTNSYEALNMLDYYYASKLENIDLKKTNLTLKYVDGFTYTDEMDDLIHQPMVKCCRLLETKNYFLRAYKKKAHFYNYYTKSRFGLKKLYIAIYVKISQNMFRRHAFYRKEIDTRLLNMSKNSFEIHGERLNYSLEEMISKYLFNKFLDYADSINEYLIDGKSRKIKKLLNISSEKKM